ncbi:hypothetical protein VB796_08650 [Arcicella sp. LKC2W]|uniref:hypothetical protein n=1 Tax=Arcicella sp. LKC2W TaxID=2984198 RepID=UPI002B1EC77A|nr:hypothetical protein [Arcicella sp. LKC2W]MEA5459103.1 hypothetical protein [Arcicella sp. LKC2W]
MTEDKFIDLMETFAINHPDIQHQANGKNRFTIKGEEIFSKITQDLDAKNFCVILSPETFSVSTEEPTAGQFFDFTKVSVEVARKSAKDENSVRTTQNLAKPIIEKFWREILFLKNKRLAPFEQGTITITNVRKNRTSGGVENLCGYRLELTFKAPIIGISSQYQSFTTTQ